MENANSQENFIDLSGVDVITASNEGAQVEITHPATGEALGITITVKGRDSEEFKRVVNEQARRRAKLMTKSGVFKVDSVNLEDVDKDHINLLAAVTVKWTPAIRILKNELPSEYTKENCARLYKYHPYIREQVDAFIGERANFLKVQ